VLLEVSGSFLRFRENKVTEVSYEGVNYRVIVTDNVEAHEFFVPLVVKDHYFECSGSYAVSTRGIPPCQCPRAVLFYADDRISTIQHSFDCSLATVSDRERYRVVSIVDPAWRAVDRPFVPPVDAYLYPRRTIARGIGGNPIGETFTLPAHDLTALVKMKDFPKKSEPDFTESLSDHDDYDFAVGGRGWRDEKAEAELDKVRLEMDKLD